MRIILSMLILASISLGAQATTPEHDQEPSGCVFDGEGFVWFVSAPDGWVLSCLAPEHSEVPIALWPTGSSWKTASVVMYVNPTPRSAPDRSVQSVITAEVARFRRDNPTVTVTEAAAIETRGEGTAAVRHYTGDRWGNYEAVAFLDTEGPVAVVVLSTEREPEFTKAYPAFQALVTGITSVEATVVPAP